MRVIVAGLAVFVAAACSAPNLPTQITTPPGSVRVAGVLLVPAESSLEESCRRAAAAGGFTVPCPGLIIQHRAPVGEGCPSEDLAYAGKDCLEVTPEGTPLSRRDSFLYTQNDIVLDGGLHLFIAGVRSDSRLAPFRTGCVGSERSEPGPDLDGEPTVWIECPDASSMNSGHVLLRWAKGDVIYAISLHGHTSVNREVELAIARNLKYIEPPR